MQLVPALGDHACAFWKDHECRVWQFEAARGTEEYCLVEHMSELHDFLVGDGSYATFSSSLGVSGWWAMTSAADHPAKLGDPPQPLWETGFKRLSFPAQVRAILPFYEPMKERIASRVES